MARFMRLLHLRGCDHVKHQLDDYNCDKSQWSMEVNREHTKSNVSGDQQLYEWKYKCSLIDYLFCCKQ